MGQKKEIRLRSRFTQDIADSVMRYVASLPFDRRLYKHDIQGSIAHAEMLAEQKIISPRELTQIKKGLQLIQLEIEQGKFQFKPELEDIHMSIESRLYEIIGDAAGKLHTARSRNDQVALDIRLFARETAQDTINVLIKLCSALVNHAGRNIQAVMPGYTHLQQAQPVLYSHYVLAYFEMFRRDIDRLEDYLKRINVLPLGSGALAGVPYPIDREFVARKLGFSSVSANSVDAVADRDFIIEYEAIAAIAMMHLSRFAEEVIIWSSKEFGFIELSDAYTTSSSIMPQKKNPDVAELARGKSARVLGTLAGMLAVMKGLPLAYNRDMQEDKQGFFDTAYTVISSIDVMTGLVASLQVKPARMKASMDSYILATDIADYLARKGLPFREAHDIVGRLVAYAMSQKKELNELDIKGYKRFSPLFKEDVYKINADSSVRARSSYGGTSPDQVKLQIQKAREILRKYEA
ncbi:MAG: argininosuccinate lyase [Dehalococcoidia bacterium]|nr:argininosuccinate lyase [Dehalococcoidia bacterium]